MTYQPVIVLVGQLAVPDLRQQVLDSRVGDEVPVLSVLGDGKTGDVPPILLFSHQEDRGALRVIIVAFIQYTYSQFLIDPVEP